MRLKTATILIFLTTIQLVSQEHFVERRSSVGEIGFILNNLGQVGYSSELNQSRFVWPKGSDAQYIYGAGLAIFTKLPNGENRNFYTYHPNTSKSDFTIGSYADTSEPTESKYRVYNSNDYDIYSGIAKEEFMNEFRWPVWVGNNKFEKIYGNYIIKNSERTRTISRPEIRSEEDMVTIAKIDASYPIEKIPNPKESGDLRIDVETKTYTLENLPNVLFITWIVHNRGTKILDSVSIAPIVDIDITRASQRFKGVDNDIMLLPEDDSYAVFATEVDETEKGEEFQYMVIDNDYKIDIEYNENQNLSRLNYGVYNLGLETDYSFFQMEDYIQPDSVKKITGEIKVFSPSHRFNLLAGKKVVLTLQILMFPANDDYPEFPKQGIENLGQVLDNNWIEFYREVRTNVDITEIRELDLFPNPARNFINIDSKYKADLVEIISLEGKVVKTSKGLDSIDITSLQSGVYILRIGEMSRKFIVE